MCDSPKQILTLFGAIQARGGYNLYVNTTGDEMVTLAIRNRQALRNLYCKHVRITMEVIDPEEIPTDTVREKCDGCLIRPAGDIGFCPYSLELFGEEIPCNCCDNCADECSVSI